MRYILAAAIAFSPALLTSCGSANADEQALAGDTGAQVSIDELREATRRFQDVQVALSEGYVPPPGGVCETAEHMGLPASEGAMGVHYFRPDLLGITATEPRVDGTGTHTDFRRPSVLIYEPAANGEMTLVAVENLVFRAAWEAAGNTEPPTFNGVRYDLMQDDPSTPADEAHMFAPHYDLHVWIGRDNPKGVYAQFNPAVTCAAAVAHTH
jgi:hypothetical protein